MKQNEGRRRRRRLELITNIRISFMPMRSIINIRKEGEIFTEPRNMYLIGWKNMEKKLKRN